MKTILSSRRDRLLAKVSIFLIVAALIAGMAGCGGGYPPCPCINSPPSQNLEIRTWYDLDAVRNNLAGHHILMNDLDSTTLGYQELAGPDGNEGMGWEPIGTFIPMCFCAGLTGTFDGQGYEIRDLFINRPDENLVGLFGCVYDNGVIKDIGVVNTTVIAKGWVGSLVGRNMGTVSNSSAISSVSGDSKVGGLVGYNQGPVLNCYATGSVVVGGVVGNVSAVIGGFGVGGLIGLSERGPVDNCYFTGSVASSFSCDAWEFLVGVGGLVGVNYATVRNSFSNANVTGKDGVGGLVGRNLFYSIIRNSYSTGSVTGNSSVGGLVGGGLNCTVSNSYSTGSVSGNEYVGGLVGHSEGSIVSNSYATGNVTGNNMVGGLVGGNSYQFGANNPATVSNSYSTGTVSGTFYVGGMVGHSEGSTVSNSFWDIENSGQSTSAGGTGKNTTEMQDIVTFSGAGWNIITVALNETNLSYVWNIVNNVTYPFLSWEP